MSGTFIILLANQYAKMIINQVSVFFSVKVTAGAALNKARQTTDEILKFILEFYSFMVWCCALYRLFLSQWKLMQ